MTDKIDLLPCPFCGAALTWEAPVAFVHPIGKCILSGRNFKKGPIQQWNRRAALPPAHDAVEALVKAAERAERVMNDPYCEPGNSITNTLAELRDALAAIRKGGDA